MRCSSQLRVGSPVRPSVPDSSTSRCIRYTITSVTMPKATISSSRCNWPPRLTVPYSLDTSRSGESATRNTAATMPA
jgi:hypothetical protein